jgi:hypothetical protein
VPLCSMMLWSALQELAGVEFTQYVRQHLWTCAYVGLPKLHVTFGGDGKLILSWAACVFGSENLSFYDPFCCSSCESHLLNA